jgi:glycosyltransferase involved in cell wall biosynthesis
VHLVDIGIKFHEQYKYTGLIRLLDRYRRVKLFEKLFKKKIQEICPDIIVCTTADPVQSITKVKGKIPLIVESHSSYYAERFEKKSILFKLNCYVNKFCLRSASEIVALTKQDAVNWRKVNSFVSVIPNIVHLNDTGMYSNCNSNHVIFVGRITYQKGLDALIEVWKLVHEKHPDCFLDIYGEGEFKEYYENIIEKLNINILIHHPESTILQRYCESSMLLLTSVYEPFGLVLPEAMSSGVPVVAFDCPYGPADIITDGVDGFLVKNRDVKEFASRVCQLIENKELRLRMGQAAIKSSQRYRAEVIMPKWEKIFDCIIN